MDIKNLELWYQKNKRSLIFRKTKEPYKIWVSEIMLQQTQVETVLPFFDRFMNVYPTVFDLANTDELTLHKVVEGLGYYRRFRYMQEAAKVIVNEFDGIFPSTYDEVIKLPGIGKYTAGAIMSIAYDLPYSALDGNVIRVLSRYLNISEDMRLEKNKKILNEINQSYIEKSHPNLYTQAMMELGAMICRPQNPKCDKCPIALYCQAHAMGIETKLPYLSKLKEKKEFNYITLIIKDESYYYLYKRTEDLLKNMYMYPQFESESIQSVLLNLEAEGIILEVINYIGNYKHVFTHLIWHMDVYEVRVLKMNHLLWEKIKIDDLNKLPMAIAHKKIII